MIAWRDGSFAASTACYRYEVSWLRSQIQGSDHSVAVHPAKARIVCIPIRCSGLWRSHQPLSDVQGPHNHLLTVFLGQCRDTGEIETVFFPLSLSQYISLSHRDLCLETCFALLWDSGFDLSSANEYFGSTTNKAKSSPGLSPSLSTSVIAMSLWENRDDFAAMGDAVVLHTLDFTSDITSDTEPLIIEKPVQVGLEPLKSLNKAAIIRLSRCFMPLHILQPPLPSIHPSLGELCTQTTQPTYSPHSAGGG